MMNNRHEYIKSVIDQLSEKDKLRLRRYELQQMYEYVYFNVSVFNFGSVVSFRQTNVFREKLIDDGYSFYLLQGELEFLLPFEELP